MKLADDLMCYVKDYLSVPMTNDNIFKAHLNNARGSI